MGSSMSVAAFEVVVTAYAGEPIAVPMVCRMEGHTALTIGRNPSNDLVLDDPARQVSRFQAKVTAKQADVELSNVSSQSCVLVNGTEIGPGETTSVRTGDQIVMGRFLLELRASDSACEETASAASVEPPAEAEPLYQSPVPPSGSSLQIPDDYDVFAVPESEEAQPAELQVNSLSDFSDSQSQALLQGLESAPATTGPQTLFDEQPPTGSALLELVEEKLDPMQLFGEASTGAVAETRALDHTPEMDRFIKLPAYEEAASPTEPETVDLPINPTEESADTSIADMVQAAEPLPEPVADTQSSPVSGQPQQAITQDSSTLPDEGPNENTGSLKAALATGAGLPVEALPELTPELMHELGTILKAMSDGTVRLMHSRSMTKHEMRANVTIIASAGNNPIKFAPDGTAALQQMLGKRFSGFMQPLAAIEDAFDDLSAHQLGLLAGARRAAIELIEKLNPDQTAAEHEQSGVLEGLLPFVKEAKLWRKHQRQYKKVAEDQEGLASLIERSFVKSYEEEIERIYTGRRQ